MDEIQKEGLGMAVISYDSPEILADFRQRHGITYPLLSDPDSETIKRYGILNTLASERVLGIPYPGTFMLDPEGVVTDRFFEDSYRDRFTAANILLKLGVSGTPVEATQISTGHIEVRTHPSDTAVALGQRFALVVQISPRDQMHVYAPGAEARGYRVVTLKVDPQPSVRVLPMAHPPSEIYYFEPLDERVPVYQKPFTLLQEVVPEVDREYFQGKDQLTLTGSLEYQACDERICYNPVSVPLSWTIAFKSLVPRAGGR